MAAFRPFRNLPWLELILACASCALLLQVFPSAWTAVRWSVDVRYWPRSAWFVLNGIVVLILVAIRFLPALLEVSQERHQKSFAHKEKQLKQQELQKQRERISEIRNAQKRRIY
jgi:endonuclease/exonuclease/phosphatase (EEP) superfamily protein YafD